MHTFPRFCSLAALAALVTASAAQAHIGYTGRNFGTLVPDGSTVSIANQTVSGGFGWADATDADFGDSHRGRFYRFNLATSATVVITAQRNALGSGPADTFLPGLSLFQGLGHLSPFQGSHDSAALSIASRPAGAEGSFRALADWSIGNDPTYNTAGDPLSGVLHPADLRHFVYIGHAADGASANYGLVSGIAGDGAADGFVTGVFADLAPGDYSIFVGGANYALQATETGTAFPTYGVTVSVAAIPEPSAFAGLAGCGSLGLAALRRRRPAR